MPSILLVLNKIRCVLLVLHIHTLLQIISFKITVSVQYTIMYLTKASIKLGLGLLSLCYFTTGYKILVISSAPSRSHYNLCKGIVDILIERGHEVDTYNENNIINKFNSIYY